MTNLEISEWSGEGTFTQTLIDAIAPIDDVGLLRVEDVPSSRVDMGYQFISNEIYIEFCTQAVRTRVKRCGFWPATATVDEKRMSLTDLGRILSESTEVGGPDYSDDGMMQYLRTERVVPPYQTRGYKLVELVRIYEVTGAGGQGRAR